MDRTQEELIDEANKEIKVLGSMIENTIINTRTFNIVGVHAAWNAMAHIFMYSRLDFDQFEKVIKQMLKKSKDMWPLG